jgi:hypothetical protein
VKTNSGTAVDTCTSCPAAIRCRTTCKLCQERPGGAGERSQIVGETNESGTRDRDGRNWWRRRSWEGRGGNLDGAGGVAEAVAREVEGEDQATRRRWRVVAASGGRHCRRMGRELWIHPTGMGRVGCYFKCS